MTVNEEMPLRAIILYDSRTSGGSTDRLIDAIGHELVETGAYVEKAKCRANADYSFVREFDLVILGAPVYYLVVSSQLLGALVQSNLKKCLKGKKIALFLACGSPEPMALTLYLPQVKVHLVRNRILSEKIFAPHQMDDPDEVEGFVEEILDEYEKADRGRPGSSQLQWDDEASDMVNAMPSFISGKIRSSLEEYARINGIKLITPEVINVARSSSMGM
ncbi:MAG: protochlorophyllide oxidoreductase [Chlorobiaceae bacterium]|nr:protochlorophyllide oxidoreductase [Chlorobiaceae bacterium]